MLLFGGRRDDSIEGIPVVHAKSGANVWITQFMKAMRDFGQMRGSSGYSSEIGRVSFAENSVRRLTRGYVARTGASLGTWAIILVRELN
jgi:hypothetical protein